MAGSVMSEACHPTMIGAGDETAYWDYQHRAVEKQDLGHKCRECRRPFTTIGEPLTERRGARLSMRYHASCFSGFADPRSQLSSSTHVGKLAGTQLEAAPNSKTGKMRTSQHFESGSALRTLELDGGARSGGGGTGKTGMGLGMGSNGFGGRSSKGTGAVVESDIAQDVTAADLPTPVANRGLNEATLHAHAQHMERIEEGS